MEKNMKRNESIEIKRILGILKSKKILIALILIVFTVLGSVYSYHYVVPKYKSTATLLLIPNSVSENREMANIELLMNSELINTYSNIAKNSKVLKQAINNLGLDMTEQELSSKMQVNITENTYIIEISVTSIDPQKAMDITNELSNVFLDEIKAIYNLNNLGIVDKAELPEQPYNINHMKDIIIFFAIGSMLSFAYVMIIYIFDNTLKKEEDIENYINIKSLGNIPIYHDKKQEIIDRDNAKSYITECMNTIRTNILYMNSAKNAKTILITSCTPQEGKSWVSANVASSFAKINKKVLLIDADMRKGRAHKIFKVDNTDGISNYLHAMTGNAKKDIKLAKKYIKETQIPNLHILTNGTVPPNPSELLDSNNMKELIALLKNAYDVIIVDAPPCKLVTDSIVLSTIIDSTVLVVNAEKTKINDLNEVKKSITSVGGEIIGAILNKKKVKGKTYSQNYYYGHNETIHKEEKKEGISVHKVIKQAILKLEKTDFKIFPEEDKLIEIPKEPNIELAKQDEKQEEMKKIIKKQNSYLEKMANTVSDMKVQLNSDRNNRNKIEELIHVKLKELQQEKSNPNYEEELTKILNQIKEVKQNNLTSEQMKEVVREEILNLEDIKQEKLTQEQVQDIIRQEILNLKDTEQEKLTQEQVQDIIKQEVSHIDYTQDIEKIYRQIEDSKMNTNKMIRKMVKHNRAQMIDTIKNKENHEQQMVEQIAQINDMLANLNDSYLELSNKIQTNSVEIPEISQIDDKKVIDFKALKKTKNKKKKAYLIEEDIPYEELEKTAKYVVLLEEKKDSDFSEEDYQNTMP